jgi:hypothetical protein
MRILLSIFCLMIYSQSFGIGYVTNAEAEQDAIRNAAEALYKQTGIEKNITEYTEKRIPNEYKPMISKVTIFTRALVTKKVEFKWSF